VQANANISDAIAAFQRGDLDRARALAEEQLERDPSPQLHHLLGLIECRMGRLERGVEWLRRASDAEPDNVSFRVMLARALVDDGRADEALAIASPPTGTSPPELALWHARAEAADAAQDWEASVGAWEQLCLAGAADWRAWNNYANALAKLGRWDNSWRAFKRALELNPGELALRRSLATALARAGRYEESADELERWVEAAPQDAGIRITFARLLADLGRHEESIAQLGKAAELTGGTAVVNEDGSGLIDIAASGTASGVDVRVLKELAHLLERTNRMDALRTLLNDAAARGVGREEVGYPAAAVALRDGDPEEAGRLLVTDDPGVDPVRWHWLMARIADALGDSETAFAEAETMNRSAHDHDRWRGQCATHLQWVRLLAATITPKWGGGLRPLRKTVRHSPAFLVGFPRSGTTLLDTFLMGHPETQVLEEVPLIREVEAALGDMAALPQRSEAQLEQARQAYFAELDRHVDPDFAGLVIDKLPLNMLAAPFLYALFPGAPMIFAQRHPCDAVLSCFMQGFALNESMACFLDIEDAAAFYDAAMSVWMRSREALPLRTHTLVYEELVTDPEAALRPAVEFLGLEWSGELLDHRATAKSRGVIGTPSYDQVVQPLSRAPSGRWRRYEKQLRPVLPVLLPWAERLGYAD
jgi:tetratricopeptide (TPR) repeat protein